MALQYEVYQNNKLKYILCQYLQNEKGQIIITIFPPLLRILNPATISQNISLKARTWFE